MRKAIAVGVFTLSRVLRACLRPLGYFAFAAAVWTLGAAARLLGREHVLGGFAGQLSDSIRRYPQVTRPGSQIAWVLWCGLVLVAVSPLDPLPTLWDEIILIALASGVLWTRVFDDAGGSKA